MQDATDSGDGTLTGHPGGGVPGDPLGGVPGSNASTLSHASSYTEKDSAGSSVCSDDHSISEYEIVKRILYSCQDNINIVHEVFRQVGEHSLISVCHRWKMFTAIWPYTIISFACTKKNKTKTKTN